MLRSAEDILHEARIRLDPPRVRAASPSLDLMESFAPSNEESILSWRSRPGKNEASFEACLFHRAASQSLEPSLESIWLTSLPDKLLPRRLAQLQGPAVRTRIVMWMKLTYQVRGKHTNDQQMQRILFQVIFKFTLFQPVPHA